MLKKNPSFPDKDDKLNARNCSMWNELYTELQYGHKMNKVGSTVFYGYAWNTLTVAT